MFNCDQNMKNLKKFNDYLIYKESIRWYNNGVLDDDNDDGDNDNEYIKPTNNKFLTLEDIKKLRPVFYLRPNDGFHMVDYFLIDFHSYWVYIRSGLKSEDNKSPYFYHKITAGKDCMKKALEHFNDWWYSLDVNK